MDAIWINFGSLITDYTDYRKVITPIFTAVMIAPIFYSEIYRFNR